jgi:oligogalacturonide lyase
MSGLTRRGFLLGMAPALSAANILEKKGTKVPPIAVKFPDPLTERPIWRLTDPRVLHHLPHYHHRFVSKRDFLLVASELTGTRQIYRMNLPDGDMVQLTAGPGVHSYSPTLDPRDREFFVLQQNTLKEIAVNNGREREIFRCPDDWRVTGHMSVSDDGVYAAIVEMRAEQMADGFEEQFRRRPRCRIRVVDTRKGTNRVILDERRWIVHPQFRPGGKEILYCSEGPPDQVEDRMWLTSLDGRDKRKLRPQKGGEQINHAYWSPEGLEIYYVHYPDSTGRGATVRSLIVQSEEERVGSRCTRFGWMMRNEDNSVIAGASRSLASPHVYVLFAPLKREMTICEHMSSGKSYPIAGTNLHDPSASWPEPVFSPDSNWVYFTSDREGQPTVYRTEVSDLVENT